MKRRKFSLIMIFLIFGGFSLFSLEFRSKNYEFYWTLDMTMGMQNLMSKENGSNVENSFLLETSGLIFHSYFNDRLTSTATLDLGFSKKPNFLWTDDPNFIRDEENLNENLKCVEFDYQFYLPKIGGWFLSFLPFGGFSFVNLAEDKFYGDNSFSYFSLSAGVQYYHKPTKWFSHTYYVSYSPMILIENLRYQHTIHYMNYGGELNFSTSLISFTLFMIVRKVYEEFGDAIFLSRENYTINTTEIGFSFKINLF